MLLSILLIASNRAAFFLKKTKLSIVMPIIKRENVIYCVLPCFLNFFQKNVTFLPDLGIWN